jgi:hypothetical protein
VEKRWDVDHPRRVDAVTLTRIGVTAIVGHGMFRTIRLSRRVIVGNECSSVTVDGVNHPVPVNGLNDRARVARVNDRVRVASRCA